MANKRFMLLSNQFYSTSVTLRTWKFYNLDATASLVLPTTTIWQHLRYKSSYRSAKLSIHLDGLLLLGNRSALEVVRYHSLAKALSCLRPQ